MSTATKERTTEPGTWVCENCQAITREPRKRCVECRTSRY
jgi:RNA polymerase subunit RPABC4/transcription elongation factor Spt4